MMTNDLQLELLDEIIFSGGVAEFIYGEPVFMRDIGHILAKKIRNHDFWVPVVEPKTKIRATVIGAGSYSLSLSGPTCYYDSSVSFPIENIPVMIVDADKSKFSIDYMHEQIEKAFQKYDREEGEEVVALYFDGPIYRKTELLKPFAEAVTKALRRTIENGVMVILLLKHDMGSMVGNTLREETDLKNNFICLDELVFEEGDWIDIGSPLTGGNTFPVTVKSLTFSSTSQ